MTAFSSQQGYKYCRVLVIPLDKCDAEGIATAPRSDPPEVTPNGLDLKPPRIFARTVPRNDAKVNLRRTDLDAIDWGEMTFQQFR
jgi:hypothetical protein